MTLLVLFPYTTLFRSTVADTISLNEFQLSNTYPTKRSILSDLSKVFDPLSLFSPVTVKAKILIQSAWKQNLSWDQKVPEQMALQWEIIKNNLIELQQLSFPRQCYNTEAKTSSLVIFCDASQHAYAFSAYIKTGNICQLVFAKVKVAPTPTKTLPTLELLSVYIALKCLPTLLNSLKVDFSKIQVFTDAQIVLSWILTDAITNKNIFVKNRCSDISRMQEEMSTKFNTIIKFHYVLSEQNPADLATRGLSCRQFIKNMPLWQNGPNWLKNPVDNWPKHQFGCLNSRSQISSNSYYTNLSLDPLLDPIIDISRFSDLNKLHRITAHVFKFIFKCLKQTIALK
jgi:hypothetical protein